MIPLVIFTDINDTYVKTRWYNDNWTRYTQQVINESNQNLYMGMHATTAPLLCENVVTATKLPSLAVLEVIKLTTSSAFSNENQRFCRSGALVIWKHSHADYSMSMFAIEVITANAWATVSDLSCCYTYNRRFHHGRNYINQQSNIWYGGKQGIYCASQICLSNVGWICLITPVYDASKRYVRHWCGLDTSEVDRDFEPRFSATHVYM